MRLINLALIAALAAVALPGCGDDDGSTGPDINAVAGTWVASPTTGGTSVIVTPNIFPALALNVVDDLDGTVTLTITTGERFTLNVNIPNPPVDVTITGDFEITGNNRATLTRDDDPDNPLTATITLSGDVLRVVVQDAELIDVTMDGMVNEQDAATIDATLAR